MENEIEVGEYIRTDKGNVGKIIEIRGGENIDTKKFQNIYKLDIGFWTVRQYIVNHSLNPIDIIEVGDYVNGYKVDNIKKGKLIIGDTTQVIEQIVENDEIETIVTKEQFESISYKVTKM